MAFNAGRVEVHLGAQLERRDFELYEKKLKEVRQQVAKKEQFKAELGGDFNPKAFNAYQRELTRTEHATNNNVKAQGRLRTSFGALYGSGGAMFAAAGGLAGLVVGLRSVIKANSEAEVSQTKLKAQLKALGISYDAHAKEIDKVIQKTSQLSGLDDEDLQDSFTAIVRSSGSVKEALKATGLAADFARAKHLDVARAGDLLGKVYAGNVGALGRYGIKVDPVTKAQDALAKNTKKATDEQIKQAKEQDKQATILATMSEAQRKFSGQAEGYGKTQAGAFDRVGVAFENLQEVIGRKLGPTITRAANRLADFITEMAEGRGEGGRFVEKLKDIWKWTKRVVDAFSDFVTFAARNFRTFVRRVREDIDMIIGWFTGLEDAMLAISRAGEKLPIIGGKFKGLSDTIERSRDRLNKLREDIRPTGHRFDDLGDVVTKLNRRLSSDRGTNAAKKNFRSLKNRIAGDINDAVSDTDKGMGRIRLSLSRALKDIGVSDLKPFKGLTVAGTDKPLPKAAGGWIGAAGMVGGDIIPAMLAPGEAVLNRHQQAVIEDLLGDGFLDRLFERIDTPHYFARGGLMGANPGLAPYAALGSQFGLSVTSGLRPGSRVRGSGNISLHASGNAIDVDAGSPGGMLAYAKAMAQRYGSGLDELIHTPLGFGIKNGRRVPPYATADHYDHVHVGDRTPGGAAGGFATQIVVPQVGGTGALRAIVQGSLRQAAKGANAALEQLTGSMGISSDFGTGGAKLTGGQYGKSQLAALWKRAGGPENIANLMAAIALAESGGNPRAHNRSGASGLWQIVGLPFPGDPFNPLTNARMAVSKYGSQGLRAWEAYTNGTYRQYLNRGGRALQFFAKGGRAGKKRHKHRGPASLISTGENRGIKRSIARGETGLATFESDIQSMERRYGQQDRIFGLSDEELLIENPDGSTTIDQDALQKRLRELDKLIELREAIRRKIADYRTAVRDLIKELKSAIKRLTRALNAAKGRSRAKERSGYRDSISGYNDRVGELRGVYADLGGDITDQDIDLVELRGERGEVASTTAKAAEPGEPQLLTEAETVERGGLEREGALAELTPDTADDESVRGRLEAFWRGVLDRLQASGASDELITQAAQALKGVLPDTSSTGSGGAPTSAEIASSALSEFATFTQGRQELLSGYARNFITAFQAGSPGGVFSGTPDELSAASGTRFFGAGSTGGLGGATINNYYAAPPDNPHVWSDQMRFQLEAA